MRPSQFDVYREASKGSADFVEVHHFAALPKYARALDEHYVDLLAAAIFWRELAHTFAEDSQTHGLRHGPAAKMYDEVIARFTPPEKSQEPTP